MLLIIVATLADTGFAEHRNRVFRLYEEKRFREALAVAEEASKSFPEYDAKTSFWIACMQARLGNHDLALKALQQALERGVWWRTETLQDEDLDSIRGRLEFSRIEEESKRLQLNVPKRLKPELMVRVPAGYSADSQWPTFIVFHQRYGERPEVSAQEWLPILSTGTIVAAPWSSQVYGWDGRCWDDWEQSEKDAAWTFAQLKAKYRLDPNKLILGGFSQGAALSIYSTLKRVIPCQGFVAVASPDWVRPEERRATDRKQLSEPFASFVRSTDCHGLRGVVIIGDRDPFFAKITELHELMLERGLEGKLIVEPGVGHEYPKGFESRLREAVDFVLA